MYFTKYRDNQGYWRWRLSGGNHETIASGEAYYNEADCDHVIPCIDYIKQTCQEDMSTISWSLDFSAQRLRESQVWAAAAAIRRYS